MAQSHLRSRLRLWRVQTMALTGLVPVVGAMVFYGTPSTGQPVGAWAALPQLVLLFVMGVLLHVYGFVLNEWADLEVDRASLDLRDKPLVSGEVSPREALWTALGAAALSFVPLALVTQEPWAFIVLFTTLLTAGAYDLFGKRMPLDVLLAGSLTLLFLAGVIASGEFDPSWRFHLTLFGCIGGLQFLQNLYQNAIEGGIKDADHDAAAGARTFAAVLGVRIVDGRVETGWAFTNAALTMKAAAIALLLYTAVEVVDLGSVEGGTAPMGLLFATIIAMVVTTSMMLPPVRFDRSRLKRIFSVHEMATFAGTVLVLAPLVGRFEALVLFLVPFLWYGVANRALFGGTLEPGV